MSGSTGLHDPVADVAARLGTLAVPGTLKEIVSAFADGLPLDAALSVQVDDGNWIVHWVSGSSLVTIEGDGGKLDTENGPLARNVGDATGKVRNLAGVNAILSATAEQSFDGRSWDVARRVTVHFDGDAKPTTFPDERYPLDNVDLRRQANEFVTALLRGIAATR